MWIGEVLALSIDRYLDPELSGIHFIQYITNCKGYTIFFKMNLGSPNFFQGKSLQKRNLKQLSLPVESRSIGSESIDSSPMASVAAPSLKLSLPKNSASNLYLRRGFKKRLNLDSEAIPEPTITFEQQLSNENLVTAQQSFVVSSPTNSSPSTSTSLTQVFTPMEDDNSQKQYSENDLTKSSFIRNNEAMTNNNSIQLQDLVQLGKIGSGNSGTVIKALHVPDSKIVAKKVIPVENNNHLVVNQLVRELTIMKSVHPHENIISFYGAYYTHSGNNEIVILMEYMNCGSLDKILSVYERICQRRPISRMEPWFSGLVVSKISYAVLNGLAYLYEKYKIIHRDIKPSNVLINSRGQVKICDFGVSKKLINSIADTFVGTSTYMSPERIQGSVYSTKGDVWSLGLMIIELVTGEFPLGGHNDTPNGILDLLQRIVNEPSPKLPSGAGYHFPREMIDFVNRCCVKDATERSSINELLCHDFIGMYKTRDKDFRHWCKKVKICIKEDKEIRREENERAKLEKKQLEKAAEAATTARR